MPDQDTKTIALGRKKMLLLALACLLFVALGLWLLTLDAVSIEAHALFRSPALIYGVALVAVAFFGMIAIVVTRKLFDKRPGLVLNGAGMLDNSSGTSVGFVPWSDIVGLEVYRSFNQRILVVKVADPDKYFGGGNRLTRYLRISSHKMCGSPVSINSAALKIGFDELAAVFQQYLSRYGGTA